jgi:type II secretory ATPase GspE/PulE/Tfp pilus assembly ATPase PilB-like protein
MPTSALLELLAQLPESDIYINPWKLITLAVLFVLWVLFAQWVDKDTVAVNTYRTVWNVISMICGTLAAALLILLPAFLAGLGAFVVINAAFATIYIVHRNGLVVEEDKICTRAHLRRVMTEGFKGGKKKKEEREVRERVRITGADGSVVAIPAEETEREQFALSQDLLFDTLWHRANLVEVVPAGQASKIRMQVDGVTSERDPLARPEGDAVLMFFKRVAGLSLEERRRPQKGQFLAALSDDHRYDVVVQTNGSTAGERLSLRVVGGEKDYKVSDIGFTAKQLETVRELMNTPHGLFLLSAPPGGGGTTTIYSFARSHDAFLQNIQTVEYERELTINNITQHLYTPSEEKTFVGELQRVVRTDPDVIVLPELRERAAAPLAAKAATQKQLVYVAVKSLDLLDALKRWMALVGDPRLVAQGLLLVTHQRLVRVLCDSCKTPYKPDPATLQKINMPADTVLYRPPEPQYDKHGNPILCQSCRGTGYRGRTGVFNMLVVDGDLRKVMAGGGSLADIRATAMRKGGLGLQQQALQKVFDGITSIEEVVRATRPPKAAPPAARRSPKPTPDKSSAA